MNTPWHVPSLRGVLGNWVIYPSLMTATQISTRVMKSKDIRESKELDDYLQRDLKPRVKKIIRYLKTRDSRFFNAILLGVFDAVPDWVEFDLNPVAKKLNLADVSEAKKSMGLLMFNGKERIFAIDGQHRAEAIRGGVASFPERLEQDQYPVIFLAHVDDKDGKVRTRRLFCDINKNAVPVSEGDKVVIDEDDLCAIVTRRVFADYPPFMKGKDIAVTEKKEQLAQDGRQKFTSLLAVYTSCKRLKPLLRIPAGTSPSAPENILEFQTVVEGFFDFIMTNEASLSRYFKTRSRDPAANRRENRNLLFRPIGLEILARLYTHFSKKNRLQVFKWGLQNLQWVAPGGVLDGTVWQDGFIENRSKARTAAVKLCLYKLHQISEEEQSELLRLMKEVAKRPPERLPPMAPVPSDLLNSSGT